MNAAAVLIINDKNEILAVSRKNNDKNFGLPGGKCDKDEPFEACAMRELFEETGLSVNTNDLEFVFEREVKGSKDFYVKTFRVKTYKGELRTDEEQKHRGEGLIRWVDQDTLFAGSFGIYNFRLFSHLKLLNNPKATYNDKHQLHSINDQPAYIDRIDPYVSYATRQWWYKDGLLHRDNKPAVILTDGSKIWYQNGMIHNFNGPAIIDADGTEHYYLNDNRVFYLWFKLMQIKQHITNLLS